MRLILRHLNTTRQALLPQIRVLEDHSLVTGSNDIYKLTPIGELVVDAMVPLLDTMSVLDNDIDYWGTHKLDFIPDHLLAKMDLLDNFRTVKPPLSEMFELNKEFLEHSKRSESIYKVTTYFHPDFPALFSELTDNDINVHLIITEEAFDKLRTDRYEHYQKLVENDLIKLFVYPKKIDFLMYTYNDHCILMHLLKISGESDPTHIICHSPDAVKWGKELFEYFLKDSIPVAGQ
ncbi:winged helix-turn-helix domain-containing protein [Methanolobus sp. ZRKC2]|uniref:helix-turn-helix transcriptional regulator n=1 Tax=Methanolobus sp. ZRKC2 TaxID=3125783 RepID=UPI00324351E2